jgi:hypothetical protein
MMDVKNQGVNKWTSLDRDGIRGWAFIHTVTNIIVP